MGTWVVVVVAALTMLAVAAIVGIAFWFLVGRGLRDSARAAVPSVSLAEVADQERRAEALQTRAQEELARAQQAVAEATRRAESAEQAAREAAAANDQARRDQDLLETRRRELQQRQDDAEARIASDRSELATRAQQVDGREARLAEREQRVADDGRSLERRSHELDERRAQAEQALAEASELRDSLRAELERIAGLTSEQARAELLAQVEHEARLEATAISREIEASATRDAEKKARTIIVGAIQRLAAEQTSESVVSTVDLPSDEMKGRIIGREGRNIRHFEQVTGVNVMIDDTPGSVLISCFDPVRRETARLALIDLVADGRIHPTRIEEAHEKSAARVEERIHRAAEDALAEVGISDLDPGLVPVLGSLTYRTSYGQNVLRHLVECAHLAGMMAAELGLDVAACKRAAFLHDIGKALTHESEGSHAIVGADLARRHGEHPDIVHAIEAHHNEVEPMTVEAVLTQAADAISGSRPGARRESLEAYVHRLERLEEIASSHEGVDKVFAMQAGREVRVMVRPDQVDDAASHALARDIAREIEAELTYPGQIRVTVVRESRASEVAH